MKEDRFKICIKTCDVFLEEHLYNFALQGIPEKVSAARSIEKYDQCFEEKVFDINNGSTVGRFCTIFFRQSNISKTENETEEVEDFYWGLCLPDVCGDDDINNFLGKIQLNEIISFDISCTIKKSRVELSVSQIVATSILSIMGGLLFIGTVVDLVTLFLRKFKPSPKEETGRVVSMLLSFSLYTNSKKILNVDTTDDTLSAVHGIRFLSMTWIILGQTYFLLNNHLIKNLSEVKKYSEDFAFQVVLRSTVATDVFYFISGLTIVYSTLKRLQKNNGLNWGWLYAHRIIRLLPAFSFVILLTFIVPMLGSGPFWDYNWKTLIGRCEKNWWPAILFVNNFVRTDEPCVEQSWFLANIMQFFILTPVVLFFLWKIPLVGLLVNTLLLATTFITPSLLMMEKNVIPSPVSLTGLNVANEYMNTIYLKPYSRIGPYAIGIYLGFILARENKFKVFKILQLVFWCVAVAFGLAVVYGPYQWSKGHFDSKEVNALYAAISGTAFAVSVAWLTYACVIGCGGIVKRLLSWKVFIPLSRTTYMAFLMHHFIIHSFNWSLREWLTLSLYTFVLMYFAFVVMIYGVAFLASITLEMPFIELEKFLLENGRKISENNNETTAAVEDLSDQELHDYLPQPVPEESGLVNESFIPENNKE